MGTQARANVGLLRERVNGSRIVTYEQTKLQRAFPAGEYDGSGEFSVTRSGEMCKAYLALCVVKIRVSSIGFVQLRQLADRLTIRLCSILFRGIDQSDALAGQVLVLQFFSD